MKYVWKYIYADLEGFNIRSSAFKIEGVDGDVYLTDFPNMITLELLDFLELMVKLSLMLIITQELWINRGEINLFPINISTSISEKIEIEVTPESNDIVQKRTFTSS